MLFHAPEFLGFFLLVLGVYWALPWHRARMLWLLAASCWFYMSWNPWLITLILFSASVDYVVALRLPAVASPWRRRLLLLFSIGINLGLLAFFKYTNFLLGTTCAGLGWLGIPLHWTDLNLILPLGISFYTFETISYIVDVYRGRTTPIRRPLDYALYILFFPHLIAGPIVRPRDFLPQLARPKRVNWDRGQLGVQLFLVGLFKKAVIADHLQSVVRPVFDHPAAYGSWAIWLAVLAFAVEIYCDFSGYSDMARGAAHLLGFKLPRNFDLPYTAASITDFWKRWHISLSSWLRDYVYVPLGGNRHGTLRTYRNLLLTMLLGGLWHGANWTFVVWGLYHGLLLVLHRALPWPRWSASVWFRPVAVAGTFLCVCVGWVFFRAQTLPEAITILGHMCQPIAGSVLTPSVTAVTLSLLALVLVTHLGWRLVQVRRLERRLPAFALGAVLAFLLLAALFLRPEDGSGFIYFQF